MCARAIILVTACLVLPVGSASQSLTFDGSPLQRFWGKLAEITSARDTGDSRDLRKAIVWLQTNARLMEQRHFTKAATSGYLLAGELYTVLSQFDRAANAYFEALRLNPKDNYLRCSLMSHLARVYATTGHLQAALKYSQRALETGRNLKCWAEALQAQAEALFYSNFHDDLDRSLQLSLLAADVFSQLRDANGQAQALVDASYSAFQLSGSEEAFRLAEEALQIWSSSGNQHGIALAHTALGYFSIRMGNPARSSSEYSQAQKVFAEMGDKDNEAIAYGGLGLLAKEIGNTDEAHEDFERSRILFAGAHDLIGEAGAVDSQAAIASGRRNYREAKRLFRYQLELTRRARHSRLEAAAYLGMGGIFDAEGSDQQALTYCQMALQLNQAIHHDYGAGESWRCLGRIYAKQQRNGEALTAFNKALTFKIAAKAASEQAAVYHDIASIDQHLGLLELAGTEIENAIQLIESERIKVSGFDDRASYFASVA